VQSFNEVGIASGDTIRMAQALACFGPGSNAAVTLALELLSNPAEAAETTLASAASAAGSFASSGNWSQLRTPPNFAPSVTKATRPTIRMGKRTAATTRLGVAIAGVLAESIPGGGVPLRLSRQAMYL
jgi:hypothetical protein